MVRHSGEPLACMIYHTQNSTENMQIKQNYPRSRKGVISGSFTGLSLVVSLQEVLIFICVFQISYNEYSQTLLI